MSNGNDPYWRHLSRDAEQFSQRVQIVRACKASRQSLIYGCQQQKHHCAADVHMPVGDRPDDFSAILPDFISFLIASVICGFARAGNYQHWRLGDKGMKSSFDVALVFATEVGNLPFEFRACHYDEGLALGKP